MAWYDTVQNTLGLDKDTLLSSIKGSSPTRILAGMTNPALNATPVGTYDVSSGVGNIGTDTGVTKYFIPAIAEAKTRTAPTTTAATVGRPATVAATDMTAANQVREQQMSLGQALTKRAAGEVPSAAELQLDRTLSKQIAAQRAQAASARGVPAGVAAKMAAEGISTAQSEAAANAAQLRAQEQAQAEQTLGSYLTGVRGQDTTAAQMEQERALAEAGYGQQAMLAQSGYQQEAALANQQAQLTTQAQKDSAVQNYIAMGLSREEAEQKAAFDVERLKADQFMQAQTLQAELARQNAEAKAKTNAGLVSTAGSIVGSIFSDERVKKDIDDVPKKSLGLFLASLKGKSYSYKKPEYDHDPGDKHVGVMAQALEKTKLGKAAVSNEDGKKKISFGRAIQLLLAGERHLYSELQALKKARSVA